MKKILSYLVLSTVCAGLLSLNACSDFLTENNKNTVTADAFYKTTEGIESLVNSCYAPTRIWYGKTVGYLLTEAGTDEMLFGNTANGSYPYFDYNSNLQATEGGLIFVWKSFYRGINAANTAIARIKESPLPANLKAVREAEVRFLRAFYYYHLVETFGPIPLRTQETTAPETTALRAPVDEIYTLIFSDLETALTNIKGVVGPQGGRVTEPAVAAFLARLYLTRDKNTEALAMADRVIKSYDFKLTENYKSLWDIANSNGSTSKEVIWFVNYSENNTLNDFGRYDDLGYFWLWEGGHHGHLMFLPYFNGLKGWQYDLESGRSLLQYMPSKYLVDLYDETKDARWAGSFRTVWWANDATTLTGGMKLGDTIAVVSKRAVSDAYRKSKPYTIYDANDIYQANGTPTTPRWRFAGLWKFADPSRSAKDVVNSKRDAFVFRLSEMYMIAAEASMKLGNTGAAADYVNVVRKRAALPGKSEEMTVKAADMTLDFMLDERAREFAGEQLRWFDLKRTGKLIERLTKYNLDAAANVRPYHLMRPIPRVEIDVLQNKTEFVQNPGYN
ncbi:RagB/SusD family nutrient uptake outer membrane protein [Spirosoma pollinicola]|uniref:RagB/SusD family nutrient uptake outer membrane protein n=1 Tax=Spirosoma pollinicola TaxID=2057025 RepID=A0A2K8YUN7_9BACT|nr:RagB/SusD family nutrient uptake outer membrane protein [Spirosoma pollinicola]AUD01340.1 RagB/SusD family nutrient uptake outer membrane protein [Spirosoma pollinicola]